MKILVGMATIRPLLLTATRREESIGFGTKQCLSIYFDSFHENQKITQNPIML